MDPRTVKPVSPSLVVVFGLPGTGKTTVARALSGELGWMHLNTDVLRTELGKRQQYDEQTKAGIYKQILDRSERELENKKGVVLDGTFYKGALREPFVQLAGRFGIPLKWIEVVAAQEVVRNRVGRKRPYSEADFQVYKKIKNEFESLKESHLIVFTDREELPEIIRKSIRFINQ